MEYTSNHIDDLIGKYLSGEASQEEIQFVQSWLTQNESNRKYFDHFKMIFDSAASVKAIPHFNTDAAWNKLKSRMKEEKGGRSVTFTPNRMNYFYRVAAGLLILAVVGIFGYNWLGPDKVTTVQVASDGRIATDTLPDGSDVTLNKETTLAYSYSKKEKQHKVKLKGEAYFNIQHNDDKTFIVEAGETLIKDIGTSFNVKAYPEQNTIEVVVEEGEVMFYTSTNTGIYLKAGGKGVYHKGTKSFTIEDAEPNVTAYKTKFFIFSDATLDEVVSAVNAVYDKKLRLGPSLGNCRLTVSFNDETIEGIASVIAETLNLTVTESYGDLLLEGQGCDGI